MFGGAAGREGAACMPRSCQAVPSAAPDVGGASVGSVSPGPGRPMDNREAFFLWDGTQCSPPPSEPPMLPPQPRQQQALASVLEHFGEPPVPPKSQQLDHEQAAYEWMFEHSSGSWASLQHPGGYQPQPQPPPPPPPPPPPQRPPRPPLLQTSCQPQEQPPQRPLQHPLEQHPQQQVPLHMQRGGLQQHSWKGGKGGGQGFFWHVPEQMAPKWMAEGRSEWLFPHTPPPCNDLASDGRPFPLSNPQESGAIFVPQGCPPPLRFAGQHGYRPQEWDHCEAEQHSRRAPASPQPGMAAAWCSPPAGGAEARGHEGGFGPQPSARGGGFHPEWGEAGSGYDGFLGMGHHYEQQGWAASSQSAATTSSDAWSIPPYMRPGLSLQVPPPPLNSSLLGCMGPRPEIVNAAPPVVGAGCSHPAWQRSAPEERWACSSFPAAHPGESNTPLSPTSFPSHHGGSGRRTKRSGLQARDGWHQQKGVRTSAAAVHNVAGVPREVRQQPQSGFAQRLRAAKAKLRHVEATGAGPAGSAGERRFCDSGAPAHRGSDAAAPASSIVPGACVPSAEVGLRAHWVLHDGADDEDCRWKGGAEVQGEPIRELHSLRAVLMRLEGAVPTGCQITVDLNGEHSVLRPGCTRRRGLLVQERRFPIAPLGGGGLGASPGGGSAGGGEDSGPPAAEPRDETAAADPDIQPAAAVKTSGKSRERPDSASFSATITLDTCELQAKTTQELKEPDIDVVEVFDTAAVVRMSGLTGDRFELTVYASGAVESLGAAATLVQRGPVRTSESVHRIGELESSQVYVAWVRVFCENHVMESKQKGFKTLQARVKTIWDEPDHVILGVSQMATTKEITKAWRHKSLQFHPDKEGDPEKKDAAEEMMKRLNLAKQNMLRSAPVDAVPSAYSATSASTSDAAQHRASEFGTQGAQRRGASSDSSSSTDDEWSSQEDKAGHPSTPKSPKVSTPQTGENSSSKDTSLEEGSLRCSLRIEALKPPKLRIALRGLTNLGVEASGLPLGSVVEVQRFVDGSWKAASCPSIATSQCMLFAIDDLEENSSYRLRLRTIVELEPLRLLFAEFAQDEAGNV